MKRFPLLRLFFLIAIIPLAVRATETSNQSEAIVISYLAIASGTIGLLYNLLKESFLDLLGVPSWRRW